MAEQSLVVHQTTHIGYFTGERGGWCAASNAFETVGFYEISYREGARRGGCGTKILPKEVSGHHSSRRI